MEDFFQNVFIYSIPLEREKCTFSSILAITKKTLPDLLQCSEEFLHLNEKKYFYSLGVEKRRHSYLLGRYLAKVGVASYLNEYDLKNIEIVNGVFHQPILIFQTRNHNVQVSITHSNRWGAALIFPEQHPMAIDVEVIDYARDLRDILDLTDKERKLVNTFGETDAARMTMLWTIKEAISKVLKTGLMTGFRVYAVESVRNCEGYYESHFENFSQYKVVSWFYGDSAWSIVLPKKTEFPVRDIIKKQYIYWE